MGNITSYKEAFPDLAQADDELKGVALASAVGVLGKKVLNNETLGPSDEKEAADRMVKLLQKWYAERKDAAASSFLTNARQAENDKEAEEPLVLARSEKNKEGPACAGIIDSPKPLGNLGDITLNDLVHKMGQ